MKFLDHLDLSKAELRNAAIQVLATAPTSPALGQVYFDSVSLQLLIWNGTAWAAKATDAALLNGQNAAFYLSRANHTGTQLASTISDLASVVKAYRLDEFAAPTADISLNGHKITGLAAPTANGDAATYDFVMTQVQASSSGIQVKDPVRVVAQSNVALTGLQTIDGVTLLAGDRVLLVGQTDPIQNGVYSAAAGAWSRHVNEDAPTELKGAFWLVNEGTLGQKTQWIVNNSTQPEVGTDPITIVQFGATTVYSASNGVTLVGSDFRAVAKASGGITVASDGIAVDTSIVARKYSTDIGDGATTTLTVTHNLGTRDVTVSVRDNSTNEIVWATPIATSTNALTLTFLQAPTAGQFRVTVTG